MPFLFLKKKFFFLTHGFDRRGGGRGQWERADDRKDGGKDYVRYHHLLGLLFSHFFFSTLLFAQNKKRIPTSFFFGRFFLTRGGFFLERK